MAFGSDSRSIVAVARAAVLTATLWVGAAHAQETPAPTPPPAPAAFDPTFVERYGTINGNMAIINHARWLISDGWSNGDWMSGQWKREQVQETAEGLVLTVQKAEPGAPKPYKNAEMRTKAELPYGYFETRMKAPRGSGIITGFFTFNLGSGPRKWQELDVEILGRDPTKVEINIHHSGKTEAKKIALGFDASKDFHTYGIEWKRGHVLWYVDGKLIYESRGKRGAPVPTAPQQIHLSLWNSEKLWAWAGGMNPKDPGPWQLTASCIAYAKTYEGKPLCN